MAVTGEVFVVFIGVEDPLCPGHINHIRTIHESWLKKSGVRSSDRSVYEHASLCRALNYMMCRATERPVECRCFFPVRH